VTDRPRTLSPGPLNLRPRPPVNEPPKHVIAEYVHKTQSVTCVCGWAGSSASPDGRTSDWTRHVMANREGKR
jgi:hypothetical protein